MKYDIRNSANPVGSVVQDEAVENFIVAMTAEWEAVKPEFTWWKVWERVGFVQVTDFLIQSLDDLIAYVDDIVESGMDKKATVLDAASRLYDFVVKEAMPIWMKPFSPNIKNIVIHGVISPTIDWVVYKYRTGEWTKKDSQELALLWKKRAMTTPWGHRPK